MALFVRISGQGLDGTVFFPAFLEEIRELALPIITLRKPLVECTGTPQLTSDFCVRAARCLKFVDASRALP